jgi:hypothetical protein
MDEYSQEYHEYLRENQEYSRFRLGTDRIEGIQEWWYLRLRNKWKVTGDERDRSADH